MVLHIVNGTVLKDYLVDKCNHDRKIIAFNESMITGESNERIFNDEFFRLRAASLGIDYDRYFQVVVTELDELLKKSHSKIVLWFDEDMFCQINLLTLCAYLDYIHFDGEVRLNIIQQNFWQYNVEDIVMKSYDLNVRGYYSLYKDVLIEKVFRKHDFPVLDEIKKGIELYKNYISANSEIRAAITEMIQSNYTKIDIIKIISDKYSNYGIGDYNIELLYQREVLRGYN